MKFSELSNHHEFYCRDNIRYVKFNFPEQFNGNSLTIYPLDYAGKIEIIEEDEEVYKQEIVRISRVSEDLRGKTFTRLTVLSYIYNSYWLCICSCGNPELIKSRGDGLIHGSITSCKCIHRENTIKRGTVHNLNKTPEYRIWAGIKQRCYNPNTEEYHNYGGRGIKMCDEWVNDPAKFCEDIGKRPSPKLSIDRIDNNGDYELSNIKWSTHKEQQNNKTTSRLLTFNGKTQTVVLWAEELGINKKTLDARLRCLGWSDEKALTHPVQKCTRG